MNTETTRKTQRIFTGVVVSTKMDKTLVVKVDRTMVHPKYGKRYVQSKKYHVHTQSGEYKDGDTVKFQESKPYSKTKRWRIVKGS
jgi:small subunit ribosomal protein S17